MAAIPEGSSSAGRWGRRVARASEPLEVSPERVPGLDPQDVAAESESAAAPRVWRPTLRPPAPERDAPRPATNKLDSHVDGAAIPRRKIPATAERSLPKKSLPRPEAARSEKISFSAGRKNADEPLEQSKTPEKVAGRKTRIKPPSADASSGKVAFRSEPEVLAIAAEALTENSTAKATTRQGCTKATDAAVTHTKSPKKAFSSKRRNEPLGSETAREKDRAVGDTQGHTSSVSRAEVQAQVALDHVPSADAELAESAPAKDPHSPAKKSSGAVKRKVNAPKDVSTEGSRTEDVEEPVKIQPARKLLNRKEDNSDAVDAKDGLKKKTGRAWHGRRSVTARPAEERELEHEEEIAAAKHDELSVVTTTDGTTSEQRLEISGNDNHSTELSQEAHDTDNTPSEASAVPADSIPAEDAGVADSQDEFPAKSVDAVAEQEVQKPDADDDIIGGAAEMQDTEEAHLKSFGQKVALFDRQRTSSDASSTVEEQSSGAAFETMEKQDEHRGKEEEETVSVSSAQPAEKASEDDIVNRAENEGFHERDEASTAEAAELEDHADDEDTSGQETTPAEAPQQDCCVDYDETHVAGKAAEAADQEEHAGGVGMHEEEEATAAEDTTEETRANEAQDPAIAAKPVESEAQAEVDIVDGQAEDESVEGDSFLAVCSVCGAVHLVELDVMAMDLNFRCAQVGAECDDEAESEAKAQLLDAKAASDAKVAPLTNEERQQLAKRHEASWGSSKESRKEAAKHLQEVSSSGKLPRMRYLDGRIVTYKGEKQLVTLLHPHVNAAKKKPDRDCAAEPAIVS